MIDVGLLLHVARLGPVFKLEMIKKVFVFITELQPNLVMVARLLCLEDTVSYMYARRALGPWQV